jgi:hypothetical protein
VSEKVRFKFTATVPGGSSSPAPLNNRVFRPPGPVTSAATSFVKVWENPVRVTVTAVIVPVYPETVIVDGYGLADPAPGIVIGVLLVKVNCALIGGADNAQATRAIASREAARDDMVARLG